MPYHVFICLKSKKPENCSFAFNWSEKKVKSIVAIPYMSGKTFLWIGKRVRPSDVYEIQVYESEKDFRELILPDGKRIMDVDDNCRIAGHINRLEVEGCSICTNDFIISPPPREVEGELMKTPVKPLSKKAKVFIVHGRDEKQALRLQKYLTKNLKIDAEMFEDFKEESSSNTIIEQLEYIKDNVGYAFVIVTPDDLGCLRENIDKCRTNMLVGKTRITVKSVCEILDNLHKRARQNVVFEHGLFIAALGRNRVCCLLQKDVKEKPSDIDGILYVSFNKSVKDTFTEIAQKLKKAGLVKT